MKKILFRESIVTHLGKFTVFNSQKGVKYISLSDDSKHYKKWLKRIMNDYIIQDATIESNAVKQLKEYSQGIRKKFDCSLDLDGTPFQLTIWETLSKIPYGTTKSYSWVATKIGNPKSVRAVGLANRQNPIPIIIPCHRIIGKNGNLTGFGGGLPLKKKLLEHESLNKNFKDMINRNSM